jgi:hypothetical protein
MYREMCERENWEPRQWTAIGRELGKMSERVVRKSKGRRFVAYRVPRS